MISEIISIIQGSKINEDVIEKCQFKAHAPLMVTMEIASN